MTHDKERVGLLGSVRAVLTESRESSGHVTSDSAGPQDSHLVIYDTEGRKTAEEWRRGDGSLRSKHVFIYDPSGNLIEESSYQPDGSLSCKSEYAYDAYDRRAKECRYTGGGAQVRERNYIYKADGGMIEETLLLDQDAEFDLEPSYKVEGTRWSFPLRGARAIKAIYDTRRKFIEVSFYRANDTLDGRILFAYDTGGRLKRVVQYDGDLFPDEDLMTWSETGSLYLTKTFLVPVHGATRALTGD